MQELEKEEQKKLNEEEVKKWFSKFYVRQQHMQVISMLWGPYIIRLIYLKCNNLLCQLFRRKARRLYSKK